MPFDLSLFGVISFPFGVYRFKSVNARTLHTLLFPLLCFKKVYIYIWENVYNSLKAKLFQWQYMHNIHLQNID